MRVSFRLLRMTQNEEDKLVSLERRKSIYKYYGLRYTRGGLMKKAKKEVNKMKRTNFVRQN